MKSRHSNTFGGAVTGGAAISLALTLLLLMLTGLAMPNEEWSCMFIIKINK